MTAPQPRAGGFSGTAQDVQRQGDVSVNEIAKELSTVQVCIIAGWLLPEESHRLPGKLSEGPAAAVEPSAVWAEKYWSRPANT